ncbi:MAG: hypothetical protein NUW06_02675 [Candidatus Acetothermia bacterium]|nr:hypothetical protein [Candidatus Acetothermia bacterium]MDH7504528.1 hypothetical protein [Candidatus Acetothermia bacterium]
MRRAVLLAIALVSVYTAAGRAELFGLGGGLTAYLLDLRGLKVELTGRGAPSEVLALVPQFAPVPNLVVRGRLSLAGLISGAQLEVGQLTLALPIDLWRRTWLSLASTALSFSLLGEARALFLSLVLSLGTDLIQGGVGLSSTDPSVAGLIDQLGLGSRSWSLAAAHSSAELALLLGPVRLYLEGKYLHPLSQSGLPLGHCQVGLGLMVTI